MSDSPDLPSAPIEHESKYPRPYAESQAAAPLDDQPSPPLSLQHLFLWTTCMAIVAGWVMRLRRDADTSLNIVTIPVLLLSIFAYGSMLAAAFLWLVRRYWFRIPFPTQPGHWFLLATCCFLLGVAFLWQPVSLGAQVVLVDVYWLLGDLFLFLLTLAVVVNAIRASTGLLAWQVHFGALGVAAGLMTLFVALRSTDLLIDTKFLSAPGSQSLFAWGGLAMAGCVVVAWGAWAVAVAIDFRSGARRDWIHYVGAAVPFLVFLEIVYLIVLMAILWAGTHRN